MPERIAIYPGSFDPITNGHVDIIRRGLEVIDRVIIAPACNGQKKSLFTLDERAGIIKSVFDDEPRVSVRPFSGLLVDFVRAVGTKLVLRGLRAVSDFEYEFQMTLMNRRLAPGIEFIYLMTDRDMLYVSSSAVRELAQHHGRVELFVPPQVVGPLKAKYREDERGYQNG